MKMIEKREENGYSTFTQKIQRSHKIHYNMKGQPYINSKWGRLYFDNVERASIGSEWSGFIGLTYFSAIMIKIDVDGESAKAVYEYTGRSSEVV